MRETNWIKKRLQNIESLKLDVQEAKLKAELRSLKRKNNTNPLRSLGYSVGFFGRELSKSFNGKMKR